MLSIAVDTHVFRVSNRLGLAIDNVLETENNLWRIYLKINGGMPMLIIIASRYAMPESQNVKYVSYHLIVLLSGEYNRKK